jgi:predicted ATPase/DNA-binding XRE family transcriptional regulator
MDTDTFGEWVKKRRKKIDLTQKALANLVGCSLSAIGKIETNERRPSRQIAELLAIHLEVPPEERILFIKIARGEGSVNRLNAVSNRSEAPAAAPGLFFPPSNIPVSPVPLIGRQQESESLVRMLADPLHRLITILGPGGIGKTRLAIEAAIAARSAFEERAYFVQLADFNTPESILPAIGTVLDIPSSDLAELKTRVVSYLGERAVLLLIDNFEHLIVGAPVLSELLQQAPRLRLLVTSRERLNLQGEWTFELGGLSVPVTSQESEAFYSAVQLFEYHVHRLRPDLPLGRKERDAAIRICQRVDGTPLAIELAAAWVNVLSCEEIANEIEQSFDFLSSLLRDVPRRHRSLRAAFEHSWKRLTEWDQKALSRLTIFQGGFNREAAEALVGADMRVLSSLESKSLLRYSQSGRLDLHEVIRKFSSEYLRDESALRRRHSEYYLDLLHKSEPALFGKDASNLLRDLFHEIGNLHIAWEWALGQKAFVSMDAALESFWMVYDNHGWLQEGIAQTGKLVAVLRNESITPDQQIYLGRALTFHGMLSFRAGNYVTARSALEEGIGILREVDETKYLSAALIFCGIVVSLMGELFYARRLMDEGVKYATANQNIWFMALGQYNQGFIAGLAGENEYAYERMHGSLALWRELGNLRFIALALNFLSPIAMQLGQPDNAQAYLQESLTICIQIHDRWGIGTAYGRLGLLALANGDTAGAKTMLAQSLSLFTDLGARRDIAWALTQLGKAFITSEDYSEAERLFKQAINLSLEVQILPQAIEAALELANCFATTGKVTEAMELILSTLQHPANTDDTKQRARELKSMIEPQINTDALEKIVLRINTATLETVLMASLTSC